MKRYYAATNSHSTSSSMGFANTWNVMVFSSKSSRDDYVDNSHDLATRAIRRDEVTKYASNLDLSSGRKVKPDTFSGQYWGIVDCDYISDDDIDGYMGHVIVCDAYDNAQRLH